MTTDESHLSDRASEPSYGSEDAPQLAPGASDAAVQAGREDSGPDEISAQVAKSEPELTDINLGQTQADVVGLDQLLESPDRGPEPRETDQDTQSDPDSI
jgi:hypothetical protein